MSCTALGTNPPIHEILGCAVEMATGSPLIASVLMFTIIMYATYKMRIPMVAAVPLAFFTAFVFAGAGNIANNIGGVDTFGVIVLGFLFVFSVALGLVVWKLKK